MHSYSDLPEEIIFAILSRVPAKSVGLCRCVSKPWRALLSQPNFIKTHCQMSKTNPQESLAIFCYDEHLSGIYSAPLDNANHLLDEITLSLTKLSFAGYPDSWDRAYGSCDGLLLVSVRGKEDKPDNMFVLNPATREIRQVPLSPFAMDPKVGFCLYGFGYDSVNNVYKMVTVSYWCSWINNQYVTNETFVDVYSLRTGSWKRLESFPYDHKSQHRLPGAFVGGCLHWLARRTTDNNPAIVAFDLVDENFREVPPPSLILDDLVVYYKLDVLGGCLCMYHADVTSEVWVMKEYGVTESWTKFTVSDHDCYCKCFLRSQEQVLVTTYKGRNIVMMNVMWNLKQGTLKEIVINGFNGDSDLLRVGASFVESLLSPQGSIELERE